MKILIVGGAGFIGSRTALRLLEEGHHVRIFDSLDPQIHGEDPASSPTWQLIAGHGEFVRGDTRDRDALGGAMEDAEAVYYFPAGTGTGQSMYQMERYCDVNVRGAAVFCELLAARGHGIRRVLVSSSRAVYGEGAARCPEHGRVAPIPRKAGDLENGDFSTRCPACGQPVEPLASLESDPFAPVSIYGITKLAQEQVIQKTAENLGIGCTVFRYQNVYGPGQSLANPYTGILTIFAQLVLAGRKISLFEDGLPTRDFVHVSDIADINVRALSDADGSSRVFNVGSGVRSTLVDLACAVSEGLGHEPSHSITGQFRLGDIRHAASDNGALEASFGKRDFVPLREGVADFVRWVSGKGGYADANNRFDNSLAEMSKAGFLRKARNP